MQIRQLTPTEINQLNDALNLVVEISKSPISSTSIQDLYDSLLTMDERPDHVILSIGLAFGQLIIEASDFEWVRIKDEYGEETCIAVKDTQLVCSPMSMIEKRLDENESLEVVNLVTATIELMLEKANSAAYRTR